MRFVVVKQAAKGRWEEILTQLGIEPRTLNGHHHNCPGCGGIDRFRFTNHGGDGTFICGGGDDGNFTVGDGFTLLQHFLGMTPKGAMDKVAALLGVEGKKLSRAEWMEIQQRIAIRERRAADLELGTLMLELLFKLQERAHGNYIKGLKDVPDDNEDNSLCKCHIPDENMKPAMAAPVDPTGEELALARSVWVLLGKAYRKGGSK